MIAAAGRRRRLLAPGINLTPLLDAILNLTFFFLVATTLRRNESALEVALPAAETARTTEGSSLPSITLDAAGRLHYDDRSWSLNDLETELRSLPAQGIYEVDIRGDEEVDFGRVVELTDACKRAGLRSANWRTAPKQPSS
jgi:biopolymer transport protein ExbD